MIVRQLKENRRLTYFDKLKGIAILCVVINVLKSVKSDGAAFLME